MTLACVLPAAGLEMAPLPLPPAAIAVVVAASIVFAFLVDFANVPVFRPLAFA